MMKLSKQQIAHQFSRAAKTYDDVAQLQRQMADYLIDQIPSQQSGLLVDLGCGTGYAIERLSDNTNHKDVKLLGLDLAPGMIEFAQQRIQWAPQVCFQVADFEQIPLPSESASIVFSNAALQWGDAIPAITEMIRILKAGGLLLLSTFGPRTLQELRTAWQAIGDTRTRVHSFDFVQPLQALLQSAGIEDLQVVTNLETLLYADVASMWQAVKKLGATNASVQRPTGLLGHQTYQQLVEIFEMELERVGHLELTFECLYFSGRKSIVSEHRVDR